VQVSYPATGLGLEHRGPLTPAERALDPLAESFEGVGDEVEAGFGLN
jgi:hypothetical protein